MIIKNSILKQTPLAEGGEGIIYEYDKNHVVKIYKDNINKQEKLNKIQKLISKQLPNNVINPIDIAMDSKKQFLGYIMKKVEGEDFKRLGNKKFIKTNNIKVKDITYMLQQIKDVLIQLHKQDIYISDLNDSNILFDKNFNIYLIDIDSWTVENEKCVVAMDTFKDPMLVSNEFSAKTDSYAFGILIFKSLTRLHPFGGITNPDMDILKRMSNKISVIDNKKVVIPKNINHWKFMSPQILKELKDIFEGNKRILINDSLDEFYNNLKECNIHKDFYYGKFNQCPICNDKAKVIMVPIKSESTSGIPYVILFTDKDINTILSFDIYLTTDGYIKHKRSNKKQKVNLKYKYYYSNDGEIIYRITDQCIDIVAQNNNYEFKKINQSNVIVNDNKVYYIDLSSNLVELTITDKGNYTKKISKVSFNNIFEIYEDNYFICNIYDSMKIININGYNHTLQDDSKIINYGLHYDSVSKKWLFIVEDDKGKFATYVFNKNNIEFKIDNIRYTNDLSNICFNNKVIFKATDKAIRGYSYEKSVYKDFACDIVNEDSKLLKEGNKFIVINENIIYKVG